MKKSLFRTIFEKYRTDKVDHDRYEWLYEEAFLAVREDIKLVFEIGVFDGGSMQGFKEYFPNATIIGLECTPRKHVEDNRVHIEIGDATNKRFIKKILNKYGNPDIVIDDGSHLSRDIKLSFKLLFPEIKFCYVIEDYCTQFQDFEDGKYINDNESATLVAHQMVDQILLYDFAKFPTKGSCRKMVVGPYICFFFKEGKSNDL